jgi:geranylgeranyl pyrophosphate synthase
VGVDDRRRQDVSLTLCVGKLNRGMSVVDTVEILKGEALSEDEYLKAAILGWCVELVRQIPALQTRSLLTRQLQAYFLVADDMMDQSVTRRGQPCWYRVVSLAQRGRKGKGTTMTLTVPAGS